MEDLGIKLLAAVPVVGAVIYALITVVNRFLKHIEHREKEDREHQVAIRDDHRASLERVCLSHEKCSSEMVAKLGEVHTDIRVIAEATRTKTDREAS